MKNRYHHKLTKFGFKYQKREFVKIGLIKDIYTLGGFTVEVFNPLLSKSYYTLSYEKIYPLSSDYFYSGRIETKPDYFEKNFDIFTDAIPK